MNIYQRLNKIREAVSYIQKDARVEGYRAITHDQVTSEVRPYLIEHGVMVVPHQVYAEVKDSGKTTKSGTQITCYIATYDIDFVNIDDPQDMVTITVSSLAEDHGDKGPGKALSYATKYAMLKLFSIETGESDESRQEQKPALISDDQVVEIEDLIKETNTDIDKFKNYMKVKSIHKIPTTAYQTAITMLKTKRDKINVSA